LMLSMTAGQQWPQKPPEVPYVPTPEKVVEDMLNMANVQKDDVLYDLGCGDGRIVITAALTKGCRGVGIDIDPQRIKESRQNAIDAGVEDKVEFLLQDLFETDISKASVVTLYLLSSVNLKLRPILFRDLEPGTRVVSHDFSMDDWKPHESLEIEVETPANENFYTDSYWDRHSVYFWVIPANVSGTWNWKMDSGSQKKDYALNLEQSFQMIEGKALEGSRSIPLTIPDAHIIGDNLKFVLERKVDGKTENLHFEGTVKGHEVEGTVTIEGQSDSSKKWKAKRVPSTLKSIEK
ncbi:SAM-dependent methyltransferase, partial [Acidobacteriota bacterium]